MSPLEDPLDRDTLRVLENDVGPAVLQTLIKVFLDEIEVTTKRAKLYISTNDHAKLEVDIHGLKSASLTLGAPRLSEMCLALEVAATMADKGSYLSLFLALRQECLITQEALSAYIYEIENGR